MINLLERISRGLGLWCAWRRCVEHHRTKGETAPTWAAFAARMRADIAAKIRQHEARQAMSAHGSFDDLYDFTDKLREAKADAVLLVIRPGSTGTFMQAFVTPGNIMNMGNALCHVASDLARQAGPPDITPGDEWKQG